MREANAVIGKVAIETDRAILFHSATGKDSIALLDLMSPHFKEIVCVFMYSVKGLEHIGRYVQWAQRKYTNARFVQIPHYSLFSYIKTGFMGCDKNENQRKYNLQQLTDMVREKTGITWAFFGFKQSDSLNRRLMLRTYEDEAICRKTSKCYPLSHYKNADILHYIEDKGLITPETYGGNYQSSGCDITDIHYLTYLQDHYPNDYQRVVEQFPMVERIIFEHQRHGKGLQEKRDDRD